MIRVLVNKRLSFVSDYTNYKLNSRSVVCYKITLTFVFWSSVRAKICIKNGSTALKIWGYLNFS